MDNILFSKFIKRITANLEDSNLERVILQELGLKDFDNLDAKLNKVTTEGLMDFFKKDEELQKQLKKLDYEEKTTDAFSALIKFFNIKDKDYKYLQNMYHQVNYPDLIGYRIDALSYNYAPDLFKPMTIKETLKVMKSSLYEYKNYEYLEGKSDKFDFIGDDKFAILCFINKESVTYIEMTPHVEKLEHYDDQNDKVTFYQTVLFKFALRTVKIANAKNVTFKIDKDATETLEDSLKYIRKIKKDHLNKDIKKEIKSLSFVNDALYMSSTLGKIERVYSNSFESMQNELFKLIDSFTNNEFKYLK